MLNIYFPREDCQVTGLAEIYAGVFGLKKDGTFVEVGAYDGVSWSNTVFLAELGWRGLYIEPIGHLAGKCKENHIGHNVAVSCELIGKDDGELLEIRHNPSAPWNYTANLAFAELNSARDFIENKHTKRLDTVLTENNFPVGFDLLVIDVEGMEEEVLRGFDCYYWKPKLVIIETHELNPNPEMAMRSGYIDGYFEKHNYMKIYTHAINTIFVRL